MARMFCAECRGVLPRLARRLAVPSIARGVPRRHVTASTETSSEEGYLALRRDQFTHFAIEPYPDYTPFTRQIPQSSQRHREVSISALPDAPEIDTVYSIKGRLVRRRQSSQKLLFFDLLDIDAHGRDSGGAVTQLVVSAKRYDEATGVHKQRLPFDALTKVAHPGDIVCIPSCLAQTELQHAEVTIDVTGVPGRTKVGEKSLFVHDMTLLAPCLRQIPFEQGLGSIERRLRQRALDMLVDTDVRKTLETRSTIIRMVRDFFHARSFREVETPILSHKVGGASALPFVTKGKAIKSDLYLRIAPELYLKQLVIGGMPRVFEIGKQFRNEGIDASHNPEFTTCEAYSAFNTIEDMMEMTEALLKYLSANGPQSATLDLPDTFRRIDIVPFLNDHLKVELAIEDPSQLAEQLQEIIEQHHISVTSPRSVIRMMDAIVGHFIEPLCKEPTFVCGHLTASSPLAKASPDQHALAARCELFIQGKEIANMYTELNDPFEQRQRFAHQQAAKAAGDLEASDTDEDYCEALEYGLPPTAGWGMGIDRLVMLMTKKQHIRDVIAFPLIKPLHEE